MSGKRAKQARRELRAAIETGDSPEYWDYVDDLTVRIHRQRIARAKRIRYSPQESLAALRAMVTFAAMMGGRL